MVTRKTRKEYYAELNSIEWRLRALLIKNRDNFKCVECGKNYELAVHHKIYANDGRKAWEYGGEHLVTLCGGCHQDAHTVTRSFRTKKPLALWQYPTGLMDMLTNL